MGFWNILTILDSRFRPFFSIENRVIKDPPSQLNNQSGCTEIKGIPLRQGEIQFFNHPSLRENIVISGPFNLKQRSKDLLIFSIWAIRLTIFHKNLLTVDQQPVVRSKRSRKPNSKYDPEVYDLDSVEMRGIPLSGKKNGWKGVYWPEWSSSTWGGKRSYRNLVFNLYKHELFQIVFRHYVNE